MRSYIPLLLVCHLVFAALLTLLPAQTLAAGGPFGQEDTAVFESLQAGRKIPDPGVYEAPAEPTVFLTFDDGPSEHTGAVLDLLRQEDVPATFFVLGQNVSSHVELLGRMVREGHAVGNHTFDHVYDKLYGSFAEFWRQTQLTETALDSKAGIQTRLLRAPGGTYTNFDGAYFYLLEQAGYIVHDWNVDSGDSKRKGVPAKEIVAGATNLSSTKKTPNEIVVLMHDGAGHGETVKALPEVIRFYKERGYKFSSLSPAVQPIQSPLGKLKWKRGLALTDYTRWLAAAREHSALYAEKPVMETLPADTAAETREGTVDESASKAPLPLPPLTLDVSGRAVTFTGNGYSMRGDKLYMPLRDIAEAMGASVEWRGSSSVAVLKLGMREVIYDLPHRFITVSGPGKPDKRMNLADISLIDSRLIVPLYTAVELLGGEIGSDSKGGDHREVRIELRPGYPLAFAPTFSFVPPNSLKK
ncbi:polysaccharide deacetylase [Paenibacillus ginsengarvi]|nr:polysaccharide deacetylase [Paenibacillus ginsengarvi]